MTDQDGEHLRESLRLLKADIAHLRERLDSVDALARATATTAAHHAQDRQGVGGWDTLTADDAADAWQRLTDWVDWLIERYQLHETIPNCWYRHPALREELDALRSAWNGAYQDDDGGPTDRLYWHEQLDRALPRLRAWNQHGCTGTTHRPDTSMHQAATDDPDRDAFINTDLDHRDATRTADDPPATNDWSQ